MARFTQYIGLSPRGREIVKNGEVIASYEGTTGIAGEPVHFNIYKVVTKTNDEIYGEEEWTDTYAEVSQAEPWSSGPMIFTCLVNLRKPTEFLGMWTDQEMY